MERLRISDENKLRLLSLAGLMVAGTLFNIDPILNRLEGKDLDDPMRGLDCLIINGLHGGIKNTPRAADQVGWHLGDSKYDWDNDGKNDGYVECEDGTIFARLTTHNCPNNMMGDFYFKVKNFEKEK